MWLAPSLLLIDNYNTNLNTISISSTFGEAHHVPCGLPTTSNLLTFKLRLQHHMDTKSVLDLVDYVYIIIIILYDFMLLWRAFHITWSWQFFGLVNILQRTVINETCLLKAWIHNYIVFSKNIYNAWLLWSNDLKNCFCATFPPFCWETPMVGCRCMGYVTCLQCMHADFQRPQDTHEQYYSEGGEYNAVALM